jgi:hypothetical protein
MNAAIRMVLAIVCAALYGCGGGGASSSTSEAPAAAVNGLAVPAQINVVTANDQ